MANLNFCPIKGNLSLPTHQDGWNLPVDLGDKGDNYSSREYLCVRPFRSSWDQNEWGQFGGYYLFKPVSYEVALSEIVSFFDRLSVQSFDEIINEQSASYSDAIGSELITLSILLFGYEEWGVNYKKVVETHFDLSETYITVEDIVQLRKSWIEHPELGCEVAHATFGSWGHLTHSWSADVHIGGNPGFTRGGKYLAHSMSPEAWMRHLELENE